MQVLYSARKFRMRPVRTKGRCHSLVLLLVGAAAAVLVAGQQEGLGLLQEEREVLLAALCLLFSRL